MIVVTGATGQLGRIIVDRLLDRLPPDAIGVSVRDPAKAAALAARGVRVRRGDFADPASLAVAFEGASQVLIVSSNARASGGDALAQHRAAIDAARRAGVRRIVYTSHMGADAGSAFPPMHDHAATEAMLAESGIAWTALRNGFYAGSGVAMLGPAFDTGVLAVPADGPVAWTAHADLGAAAALILTDAGHDGPTPPLTGPAALTMADLAALAAGAMGRPVTRQVVDDAVFTAQLTARGVPGPAAAIALAFYAASRAGEFATVDPALARLLGRAPVAMQVVIGEAVERRPRP